MMKNLGKKKQMYTNRWMDKQIVVCYLVIQKNELLMYSTAWMNLE